MQYIVQHEQWGGLAGIQVEAISSSDGRVITRGTTDKNGHVNFPQLQPGGDYYVRPMVTRGGKTGAVNVMPLDPGQTVQPQTPLETAQLQPQPPFAQTPNLSTTQPDTQSVGETPLPQGAGGGVGGGEECAATQVCITYSVTFAGDGTLPYVDVTITDEEGGEWTETVIIPNKNGTIYTVIPAAGELSYTPNLNGGSGTIEASLDECEELD